MKRFVILLVSVFVFQASFALNELRPYPLIFDACMEEYEALSSINEAGYNNAVAACYEIYQFPYNTQCHSQAIMMWSDYQEQIFDYMVTCQNGNFGRSKSVQGQK